MLDPSIGSISWLIEVFCSSTAFCVRTASAYVILGFFVPSVKLTLFSTPTRTRTRTPVVLVLPFVGTVVALIGGLVVSRIRRAPITKAAPSPATPPIPLAKARTAAAQVTNVAEVNSWPSRNFRRTKSQSNRSTRSTFTTRLSFLRSDRLHHKNKRMKFTHSNTLSSSSIVDQSSSHIPLDFHATPYDRSTYATAP